MVSRKNELPENKNQFFTLILSESYILSYQWTYIFMNTNLHCKYWNRTKYTYLGNWESSSATEGGGLDGWEDFLIQRGSPDKCKTRSPLSAKLQKCLLKETSES